LRQRRLLLPEPFPTLISTALSRVPWLALAGKAVAAASVFFAILLALSRHAQAVHLASLYVGLAAGLLMLSEVKRAGIPELLTRDAWEMLATEIRLPPVVSRAGKVSALIHIKSFAPHGEPLPDLEAVIELDGRFEASRQAAQPVKPDGTWHLIRVDHEVPPVRYQQFCGVVPATKHMRVGVKLFVKGSNNLVLDATVIGEVEGQPLIISTAAI
jgi:hypothetical protein